MFLKSLFLIQCSMFSSKIPINIFLSRVLLLIFISIYVSSVIQSVWVTDDAYITFRSVENFIHGYGPVFNIGERVQTFTHPLWFFLQASAYAVAQHFGLLNAWSPLYYITVYLSIGFSLATTLVLAFGIAHSFRMAALGLIILILSKAFLDYSTSGLENPLTHFLCSLFLLIFLREQGQSQQKMFLLSLITGLAGLNRFDTLLLCLPALIYTVAQNQSKLRALKTCLIGLSPLILWHLFSFFYYGLPFPNTAYAKLNTGISTLSLARQGLFYYLNSLRLDPLSLLTILSACILTTFSIQKPHYPILAGIILYLLYVIYIGGDFMSGRFFSAPLLVSVVLLSTYEISFKKVYIIILSTVIAIGLLPIISRPLFCSEDTQLTNFKASIDALRFGDHGICDIRTVYTLRRHYNYWPLSVPRRPIPGSEFSGQKWIFRLEQGIKVKLVGQLGKAGYYAGPNIHVIDTNALADPFLIHLPLRNPSQWRIGHFQRIIPKGYMETLESGQNQIQDENLSRFYEVIRLVTRGQLFDPNRLKAIWKLNTGQYKYLIDAYQVSQN